MEARIQKRLANSGTGRGTVPNTTVKVGGSPNRTITNIHHAAGHSSPLNAQADRSGEDWRKK